MPYRECCKIQGVVALIGVVSIDILIYKTSYVSLSRISCMFVILTAREEGHNGPVCGVAWSAMLNISRNNSNLCHELVNCALIDRDQNVVD